MEPNGSSPKKAVHHNVQMYDSYYQKPDFWFQFRYDTQVKRKTCFHLLNLTERGKSSQRVLEIGFGSGAVLFSFDTSCELHGIEISRSAVDRATKKAQTHGYKKFDFKLSTNDLLPYPDDFFDIILASHVIEHVENDTRLLSEIHRILKPNGVAVLIIPINEKYDDPNHFRRYTSVQFIRLLNDCSFRIRAQMENELLFHLVERFYFEEYNYRWNVLGPLIAMLFNFPTSILPFWAYQVIDFGLMKLGWKPRQFGCAVSKQA
jgi:ubiquinone/menaquinone biosynthesis C-methylase UbiE